MPGPRNSKKLKKQQAGKDKARSRRNILKEVEQNVPNESFVKDAVIAVNETRLPDSSALKKEDRAIASETALSSACQEMKNGPQGERLVAQPTNLPPVPIPFDNPFITDPGNGPRVKNTEAFLSSFFCPPLSLEDRDCASFAREEVLTVLEAVLPREVALIVWYNKTRTYGRICPACQRLYRMGDSLVDPVSGELVDMSNPQTPPHVLREQQLSGICSLPCFFVASYSSHPYTAEVARSAWGLLSDELDAQTRSLLDATDPRTAAFLRYGLSAWTPSLTGAPEGGLDDQSLGRVMRMTRRKDLGLGEVLEALAWYEEERENEKHNRQLDDREDISQDAGQLGTVGERRVGNEQQPSYSSPRLGTPKGIRA